MSKNWEVFESNSNRNIRYPIEKRNRNELSSCGKIRNTVSTASKSYKCERDPFGTSNAHKKPITTSISCLRTNFLLTNFLDAAHLVSLYQIRDKFNVFYSVTLFKPM